MTRIKHADGRYLRYLYGETLSFFPPTEYGWTDQVALAATWTDTSGRWIVAMLAKVGVSAEAI